MQYFRKSVSFDIKPDDSPVTIADREIEQAIRILLGDRFPGHAIYGEEQGQSSGEGGTWVIDPIDGTKSFLLGNPLFGCLVGFVEDGAVQAGGLAMPALPVHPPARPRLRQNRPGNRIVDSPARNFWFRRWDL